MVIRLLTVLLALALVGTLASPHAHADRAADVAIEVIEELEPDPMVILSITPPGARRPSVPAAQLRLTLPDPAPASPPPVPPPER